MTRLSTILIANRGEIAVRVMRTAKRLGLRTVAVYSAADVDALHVREADAAWPIGDAPVAASYLNIDAIIEAARATDADAIHPGYGFLSENASFASACHDAGIVFIGPPIHAIEVMGDKAKAKRAMLKSGVPCVPGYQGEDQSIETLCAQAREIGLPLMVKAAAGGGGRGMRLVEDLSQLESAIRMAQSEAENAFGSSELIIEKAILNPRHVELQIFADCHGNVVHLGERDCSIQRRHQKVVEESPCPVMTPSLRAAMGDAAIAAAQSVAYVGAGTVEFLLDEEGQFYFLEMNTRLQVEHPVTELVTGYDLVEWQLRVARGEPLPAVQGDVEIAGHAIEVRLYAEDPRNGFLPATGPVIHFSVPSLPGVRLDTGVESGDEISPFYDPMVAKLIAAGPTREDARHRLLTALSGAALFGVANNRDFLISVLANDRFAAGEATTAFIGEQYGESLGFDPISNTDLSAAAVIQHVLALEAATEKALSVSSELLDWSSTGEQVYSRAYRRDGALVDVKIAANAEGTYRVSLAEETYHIKVVNVVGDKAVLDINGRRQRYVFAAQGTDTLHMASLHATWTVIDECQRPPESAELAATGAVVAPMHGLLLSVHVAIGDSVTQGQRLAVLEAMKMQHEINAPVAGKVTTIAAGSGVQISASDLILIIEEA